jgi:hypothetical protein
MPMTLERSLQYQNGEVTKDPAAIDAFLDSVRQKRETAKFFPPATVLKGVMLDNLVFTRTEMQQIGTLKFSLGKDLPIFEEADLEINLSPETKSPLSGMAFALALPEKTITLEVWFNDLSTRYRKDKNLEQIIKDDLLKALKKDRWQLDWMGAWGVSD